jgi:TetR/AcrR family transcriptional repressor of uid operon
MSPKVSSQYKIEIREKIIQSAIIIFSIHGFDKARMEDISIDANISKGTLYLYFKSKEDLFYAICENNIKTLKEQLGVLLSQKKEDLISNTEKFFDNFQNIIKDDEQKISFEIIAECSRNPRLRKVMYEHRIKIFEIVSEYLNLQIEKGFFKKDIDVYALASGLVSLFDGLTLSKIVGISNDFNKKAWTETIKAIFASISRQ